MLSWVAQSYARKIIDVVPHADISLHEEFDVSVLTQLIVSNNG